MLLAKTQRSGFMNGYVPMKDAGGYPAGLKRWLCEDCGTIMGKHLAWPLVLLLQLVCGCSGAASMHFTYSVYNTTIYENSAAKTYLESHNKMGIYITDPTWEIRYKIIAGDNENLFKAEDHVLGDFSFLRIRTKGGSTAILNREVKDHYVLTVKASERNTNLESRTRVMVQVLDTNDLRPLFSPTSYSISLPENTAIRASVAKVTATDADIGTNGEYYYSFREWTDMFAVHPTSGVVTLTGKLDYSETRLYELEILAVDRGMKLYGSSGFSSMAKLTVRVEQANEHAPVITAVTLAPSDADHDPTYAIVTVEDNDFGPNGEIASLTIVAGDPLQQFKAVRTSPGSKEYKIKAVKDVDWDSQPYGYNLTLQAKDKGNPPQFSSAKLVHVTTAQFKFNPPNFDHAIYRVNLSEFAPLHTPVTMVTAVPKYLHLKYAFRHKSDKNRFTINPDTGLISVAGPINADSTSQFELDVITSDKKASTKVIVDVIDVNNNAPEFHQTSYKASVDENVAAGTSVLSVKATDLDKGENGYVTYSITNLTPQPFVIDYFSGVISTSEVLDYELMPRIYHLKVRASDWGTPFRREVEAPVTINLNNLNDNKPLFENVDCGVTVPRDHGVGEQVTTVSAIDADELQLVRYYIKAGNDLDLFELNPNSGVLSLKHPLSEGEAAKVSFHSLQIIASDGEHDTQPMYMNITVITARKPVQLKCVETGVATMLAEKLLQGSKVHTQNEPDDFPDIHSINRYTPQFGDSFPSAVEITEDLLVGFIKEDAIVGTSVMSVKAEDEDSGQDGEIRYSIRDGSGLGIFTIDEETGVIRTQELLDHETTPHYWLTVYAMDRGVVPQSAFVEVYVEVQDVNDNAPQTSEPVYYPSVMENSPKDVSIIQIQATDPDTQSSEKLSYRITSGNPQGFFAITSKTGLVTTTSRRLDREQQDEHILEVTVTDQGVPPKSTTVRIIVKVLDENDNRPLFLEKIYKIKLPERERPEKERGLKRDPVYRVIASDRDNGPNSEISYSIEEGDEQGKFFIEPKTGLVSSKKFSSAGEYDILTIKAVDNGRPQKSSTCRLHIEWIPRPNIPADAAPLQFEEPPFTFSVMESDPVAHMVGVVATESSELPVWFEITGGNYDSRFDVGKASGTLIVAKPLDAEQKSNYNLTVEASDGTRTVSTQVLIRVIDTNNHRPQFSQQRYEVTIPEDTPAGTEVLTITATDQDEKNKLTFTLLSSTDPFSLKKFRLDAGTGSLYTAEPLDHETMHTHILTVMVRDQDIPVKRNLVRVIVNVDDTNDNAPWFIGTPYSGRVFESAAVGTAVLQVTALDKDKGQNAELLYSIESGNVANAFSIDPVLGTITVSKELDRSSKTQFELTVKASDRGLTPLSTTTTVDIAVTVSDNAAPKFSEKEYSAEVSELANPGTFVSLVTAVSQSSIFYQIKGGNINNAFDINPNSGVVVTLKSLDFETTSQYKLTVQATNMAGLSNNATLLIHLKDENDNAPVFIQNEFKGVVSESAPVNSIVLTPDNTPFVIRATDADSDRNALLIYQIVEPFAHNYFAIDSSTGAIRITTPLDYERRNVFLFTVQAHDLGMPRLFAEKAANVTVKVIDINDCSPVFSKDRYEASIIIPTYKGVEVIQVNATDADSKPNARLLYSLAEAEDMPIGTEIDIIQAESELPVVYTLVRGNTPESNENEMFVVDRDSGTLKLQKSLDHETTKWYQLTLMAQSKNKDYDVVASVSVNIQIKDLNDNKPVFESDPYEAVIVENLSSGTQVIQVKANDLDAGTNGHIVYSLDPKQESEEVSELFAVNSETGWITTLKELDREKVDDYTITVLATDQGDKVQHVTSTQVEVTVADVNDNPPRFTAEIYKGTVSEDDPPGGVIAILSTTDDDSEDVNKQVNYFITGGDPLGQFVIENIQNEWKVSVRKPLDREEKDNYLLNITASDGIFTAKAVVEVKVLDANDNSPLCEKSLYSESVPEDSSAGRLILQVSATDADIRSNAQVSFQLQGEGAQLFTIDADTGELKTFQPLDREEAEKHRFTVRAVDGGGRFCEADIHITVEDVNDHPPQFSSDPYTFTVFENTEIGTYVAKLTATDVDTGDIFVIEPLDYELSHEYYITVEATDGGSPPLSDMATVNINLTDANDNAPLFSQSTYTAVVSEDAELGKTVLTVVAQDADGPSYSHVHYSIVEGNQGSPFTIDPSRGELKVARQLDRERISGYSLTVLATDNGLPALSSTTVINIDILDINDNPPLFSQANYSLIIQENRPQGTSVLQLTVSDLDAGYNGPPFSFSIADGNEDGAFQIHPSGALVTAGELSRKHKEHYLLHAQVSDSGQPQLSSSSFISVRIIEESIYPPAILPLDVFISTAGDEYPGGVLGKIHATDQDIYDTLTYSLAPSSSAPMHEDNTALFSVASSDGKIIALKPLDVGHYPLNVTVTDGRFTTAADVNVHVRQVQRQALDNSIAVRFANIAPEEFIGDYWRNFQRALRNIAGVRRSEVQLVSLQPSEQGDLDVLLALERAGSPYQPQEVVFRKLNSSAAVIEEMTGVRIVRVVQKLCAGLDCPLRFCDEDISLDKSSMNTYSTARLSFVTPRHMRTATCQCQGGKCPILNNLCDNNPCPEGMECVADPRENLYSCVCPQGKKGKCSDGHSLTFNGNGYIKYHLMENDNKELMKLSLRLKTFSSHATVMYAKGTDYSILEIVNGRVQYKFDCGSGPGLVSVHSAQVSDGEWHTLSLEVDGNYAKLVLDRVHAASGTAPGTLRTLNLDNSIYFGGHVRQHASSRHGRSLPLVNGFRGCMEAISLNGLELPLNTKARRVHAVLEDMLDVAPGCALAPVESCSSNPCTNEGTCTSLPNGGYFCKCPGSFMGAHCEIGISPCASNPCLYGGTCVPHAGDFYCQCRGQYSGQRCQMGPYCRDNPCKNSGKCIDSLDGPVCECEAGFQGEKCLTDIDECVKNPCSNGGQCHNTYGSYRCNCSSGFTGAACEQRAEVRNDFVSTSWNIGLEEVVGIVVFVSSIFILVLLFILIRKRACRNKAKEEEDKSAVGSSVPHSFLHRPYFDSKLNKNIYSDIPPQVPVRPISYTPSIPSDSRNNLDRNSFEGSAIPEHPEFSTFNPDAVHGHRKTVAVCSVAPNLPPPPPSNSVSDSDSIQKPNWDYDYDAKVVDLDPCLTKKPVEESACHPYNTRGSMSEVQSLSSFQSESCDDNGYHWDTSDWMPSVQLPGIQELPQREVVEYPDPSAIDTDYYPGGYDIESDFPPPPEDFHLSEDLPPPPPTSSSLPDYDTLRPRGLEPPATQVRQRPDLPHLYSLNQYLPQHSYPSDRGDGQGSSTSPGSTPPCSSIAGPLRAGFSSLDSAALDDVSLYASTASCSDMSACCEESEVMLSDYDSGEGEEDDLLERLVIPDSQQHTQV
uniref:Protocadherin Fat 1 n=1 Tax=Knipowitschia caucasica TaxID=637954 RepID=A0AAV2LEZ3_KNICA